MVIIQSYIACQQIELANFILRREWFNGHIKAFEVDGLIVISHKTFIAKMT